MTRVYEEIIDFIAAGTSPDEVAEFRPSNAAREHVAELLAREKAETLSPDDAAELNHYLQLEHLMRMAKARARQHLPHE
jgi:hypothetical protein